MNKEYIEQQCPMYRDVAEAIMDGRRDNYDGADGARVVIRLCDMIDDLLAELNRK